MGPLSLAILFSADRRPAPLAAGHHFSCAAHPDFPAGFSHDLLLLPQGLLSGVLSRSAGLRRRRSGRAQLSRRDPLSFHPAERASLLSLCRHRVSLLPVV